MPHPSQQLEPRRIRRTLPAKFALAAVATVGLASAGCGSSSSNGVSAAAYVKSVCGAAATWFESVQSVGGKLQAAVHTHKSLPQTKASYTTFVTGLLHATERAEGQLKAAGTPAVNNGKQISDSIVHAFSRAAHGLAGAAAAARKLPTTSSTAFRNAATRVQAQIQRSLASLAAVAPQRNPQLRAAALKDPTCQHLRRLG